MPGRKEEGGNRQIADYLTDDKRNEFWPAPSTRSGVGKSSKTSHKGNARVIRPIQR